MKGPLREILLDTFSAHNVHRSPLFNIQWVQKFINDFLDNQADTAKEIWTLLMFELWRQQHGL